MTTAVPLTSSGKCGHILEGRDKSGGDSAGKVTLMKRSAIPTICLHEESQVCGHAEVKRGCLLWLPAPFHVQSV